MWNLCKLKFECYENYYVSGSKVVLLLCLMEAFIRMNTSFKCDLGPGPGPGPLIYQEVGLDPL